MTRSLMFTLVGTSLGLAACSLGTIGNTVHVSSLAGLRTAIDNAPPGGRTITLDRGVYHQSEPIRIVGKKHLTITGATSNFADTVIRGPGINDASLQINIRLDNSDYVTIKNLTLRDSYYHGVQINNDSDYFVADNVRTLDNGESGFKVTSPTNASGASAYSDHGVIRNSRLGFTHGGERSVVEGVDIVGAKDWRLQGNTFNNIKKVHGGPAYGAFAKGNAQDIVFENNIVKNSFVGLSFGGGGTAPRYFRNGDTTFETRGGVIRNNRIFDLTDTGIYLNKAHDFNVDGNTVIRNGQNTGAIEVRYKQSHGVVENNRLSGPIKLRDGGTATLRNNTHISRDTAIPK